MKWKVYLQQAIAQDNPPLWLRLFLTPFSLCAPLYGVLQHSRTQAYRHNLLPSYTLPCKVISVGNLTLGGTGKTPFVALLAQCLSARGYRLAIISRGYGGKATEEIQLVSDGISLCLHPPFAADEAYMLARKLPTIPVLCGKNRYQVGLYTLTHFPVDLLIMDDGFQHLPLTRTVDILLVDSTVSLEKARLFPRGILREPLSAIARADVIVLTKTATSSPPAFIRLLRHYNNRAPLYHSSYVAHSLFQTNTQQRLSLETLRGAPVLAFCGIAHPTSFFASITGLGGILVGTHPFPDHHPYTAAEIAMLIREAQTKGAVALLTTEKDSARLFPHLPCSFPLWEIRIETAVQEQGWLESIEKAL
jgi:tetraacyldisaccharide 4'-kinase